MNIFVAFFVLLLLLAESTPPAASRCVSNLQTWLTRILQYSAHWSLLLPEHDHDHPLDFSICDRH